MKVFTEIDRMPQLLTYYYKCHKVRSWGCLRLWNAHMLGCGAPICKLQGGDAGLCALWLFSSDSPGGGVLGPTCGFIFVALEKHKPSLSASCRLIAEFHFHTDKLFKFFAFLSFKGESCLRPY